MTTVGASLLRDMLDALDGDPELRERVRRLIAPEAPTVANADYIDRHTAGLGPKEWTTVTHEIPSFKVGRRLLVRRADLNAWIERHRVNRGAGKEAASGASGEPDGFQRLIEAGRLRVVRADE